MSKRGARRQAPAFSKLTAATWVGTAFSIGLLYLAASAVYSDMGTFRSCSTNNSDLALSNCGKQAFNVGDFVLLGLFLLSAALAATMCTAAWRTVKKEKS